MKELTNEKMLPLVEAIEKATGQRVHLTTALRWCQRRKGACLQSYMVGGRRMTTRGDVLAFVEARTAETTRPSRVPKLRQQSRRERDAEKAEQQLAKQLG